MKRDFDLIRKIMIDVQNAKPNMGLFRVEFDDEDARVVMEHCALLVSANLLDGRVTRSDAGIIHNVEITGLTWKGHDFVDAATNDSLWERAKSSVLRGATGITFSLLQKWLEVQIQSMIGLPLND